MLSQKMDPYELRQNAGLEGNFVIIIPWGINMQSIKKWKHKHQYSK
jgi:hypothetical protein